MQSKQGVLCCKYSNYTIATNIVQKYSQLNDIWKELVLDSFAGNFEYQHSWKYTFMKIQRKNCELVEYKPLVIEGIATISRQPIQST